MILPITLTIAAAAAILHVWLAGRVSRVRRIVKVSVGDGGNEALLRRIRAHGNYVENMPIFVILVGLLELAGADRRFLWGAAITFVLARIAHAFGMDQASPSRLRLVGMVTSTLVLLGLGIYAIVIAYQSPPIRGGIQISPARQAAVQP
jgi:uncharacterized membrane protein YecN with MAPEG domain